MRSMKTPTPLDVLAAQVPAPAPVPPPPDTTPGVPPRPETGAPTPESGPMGDVVGYGVLVAGEGRLGVGFLMF